MRVFILLVMFAFSSVAAAFSGTVNVNIAYVKAYKKYAAEDVEEFEVRDFMGAAAFLGAVQGMADVYNDLGFSSSICYAQGATSRQLADISAKFILANPEHHAESLSYVVWLSHASVFGLDSDESCWSHEYWIDHNFQIEGDGEPF